MISGNRAANTVAAVLLVLALVSGCESGKDSSPDEDRANTMRDREGNVYKTVQIGNQVWMAENLRVTSFRDGTPIPRITNLRTAPVPRIISPHAYAHGQQTGKPSGGIIPDTVTGQFPELEALRPDLSQYTGGWRRNTSAMVNPYDWNYTVDTSLYAGHRGFLYNWHAVADPRGLAPEGWRIPTREDWQRLIATLGGTPIAGHKLKHTTGWRGGGSGSNESGFTAVPDLSIYYLDWFALDGWEARWWSGTGDGRGAWFVYLWAGSKRAELLNPLNASHSDHYAVRCIRN